MGSDSHGNLDRYFVAYIYIYIHIYVYIYIYIHADTTGLCMQVCINTRLQMHISVHPERNMAWGRNWTELSENDLYHGMY